MNLEMRSVYWRVNDEEKSKKIYFWGYPDSSNNFSLQAAAAIDVPQLKGRVNDYAGILDNSQQAALDNLLLDSENKTSSQVALLAIPPFKEKYWKIIPSK